MKTLEWNPGEPMNKEFALSVVESMRKFIRGRYYMPQKQAFNGKADFEAWMQELNGLREIVESSIKE